MEESLVKVIGERYRQVLERIEETAQRAGRPAGSVRLVVVTKTQPLDVVRQAAAAGVEILGENYADEAVSKIDSLKDDYDVEWHMIGHVQSRKADLVARYFTMIHSLDSLKLARRLDRFCAQAGRRLPALLECNIGGEASKYGFPAADERLWPDLLSEFEQIARLPHLRLRGLMAMPPYALDPERARPHFQHLCRLRQFLVEHLPEVDWSELSMGTSVDYRVAVEEGATYVRIGTAIVGPRPSQH
ncbi:MAG: YggS family pyridoxal phosphate-dependent enzyme [Anaerolineales bacterium]|nr:YggS family pyridoxal phosphate-dependent enzyme [Anaerolineales bacterium]